MTAPKPNAELAYRVLDHIDAHPEQWSQGQWVGKAECGTIGCFAGWAVMLSGYQVDDEAEVCANPEGRPNLVGEHVETASDRLLGIDDDTAQQYGDIYDGLLTRNELGQRVAEIFGPRPCANCLPGHDCERGDYATDIDLDVPPNAGSAS